MIMWLWRLLIATVLVVSLSICNGDIGFGSGDENYAELEVQVPPLVNNDVIPMFNELDLPSKPDGDSLSQSIEEVQDVEDNLTVGDDILVVVGQDGASALSTSTPVFKNEHASQVHNLVKDTAITEMIVDDVEGGVSAVNATESIAADKESSETPLFLGDTTTTSAVLDVSKSSDSTASLEGALIDQIPLPAGTTDEIDASENFNSGDGMEALLDQLDSAALELEALKIVNVALNATLQSSQDEMRVLKEELIQLKTQLNAVNSTLIDLQSESETKANISSTQWEEQTKQHAREVAVLTEKVAVAERNASTLEIKARVEKNEKIIARLSHENCMMEQQAARNLQEDEVLELRAEIARIRKLGVAQCASGGSPSVGAGATTGPTGGSFATKRERMPVECEASQCWDTLLSKYVFFWAAEHQGQHQPDVQKKPVRSARGGDKLAHASPQTASTAPVASAASAASAPSRAVHPVGRSDVDLDKVGDDPQHASQVARGLHLLHQGGAVAMTVYLTHINPVLMTLLQYEFHAAGVVVRAFWDGLTWTWSSALSPFLFDTLVPTLQNVYYTQVMPFVTSTIYPWYKLNAEHSVDSFVQSVTKQWEEHYEEPFNYHIADPFDYMVGRVYYVSYFTVKFLEEGDLTEQLRDFGGSLLHFIPSVIHQLTSIGALQAQFGEQCQLVVSLGVYGSVALFAYLTRRIVLGIVALVAVVLLSPLLVAIYVFAKVVAMMRPRKKSPKRTSTGAGRPSRGQGGQGGNGYPPNAGSVHLSQQSHQSQAQVSTRQLPHSAPVAVVVAPAPNSRRQEGPPQARDAPPMGMGSTGQYASYGVPPRPNSNNPNKQDLRQNPSAGRPFVNNNNNHADLWSGVEP